jgi:hypothetical protein
VILQGKNLFSDVNMLLEAEGGVHCILSMFSEN